MGKRIGVTIDRYRFSLCSDENTLQLDSGIGCTSEMQKSVELYILMNEFYGT